MFHFSEGRKWVLILPKQRKQNTPCRCGHSRASEARQPSLSSGPCSWMGQRGGEGEQRQGPMAPRSRNHDVLGRLDPEEASFGKGLSGFPGVKLSSCRKVSLQQALRLPLQFNYKEDKCSLARCLLFQDLGVLVGRGSHRPAPGVTAGHAGPGFSCISALIQTQAIAGALSSTLKSWRDRSPSGLNNPIKCSVAWKKCFFQLDLL